MKEKIKHKYFYGIYGIRFIWHGEWSDPELIWHRKSFNYNDLENWLWDIYNEEPQTNTFEVWVKKNSDMVRSYLYELNENKNYWGSK